MSKMIFLKLAMILTLSASVAHGATKKNRAFPAITQIDFMTGLTNPWDMAFMSDGTMFYTEKCRGLSMRAADGTITFLFGAVGAQTVAPDFFCEGQTGMHGVALDPDFANNHMIYVYMPSLAADRSKSNHVVKLELDPTHMQVLSRVDIITDIPFKAVGNAWGDPGAHSGGRIRFAPDNTLFVTTGDNHNGFIPQDLTSLGGKVLRVDSNGAAIVGDNPPLDIDARIYAYGFRNVQGLTFHPVTGQAFIAEHGPNHSDEVTALVAGGNGGWDPKPEAGVICDDNYCGYTSNKLDGTPTPMTDLVKFPGALVPLLSNNDSQGMGPLTFITGSQWGDWDGGLVVGIMAGTRLEVLTVDSANKLIGVDKPAVPAQRPRAIVQGPDGFIYVATDEGNIWQIQPQ